MITYIVIAILVAMAGHFKGRMDALVDLEIKETEWHKKYDFTKPGTTKHWWYFGLYTPTFPEKFPFSTTVLVSLTDRWHRAQFFMLRSFYLAISLAMTDSWIVILLSTFILMPIILGVFFEGSYGDLKDRIGRQSTTTSSGDEPNDTTQVTSVPEKQIGD